MNNKSARGLENTDYVVITYLERAVHDSPHISNPSSLLLGILKTPSKAVIHVLDS